MSDEATDTRVINVRPIPKPQRHPQIFEALDALAVGQSVVVQNDHNPIPLRGQVETLYGDQFGWSYLEEGPEVFRLQFTRRAAAPDGWQRMRAPQHGLPMVEAAPVAPSAEAIWVDLLERAGAGAHGGPQWAHECEDLNVTLLSWTEGKRIEPHTNTEVDGLFIGVEGTGVVTVNGTSHEMRPGVALLIPKGCERGIRSTAARFSYLSVHKRRRGLVPTIGGRPVG